MATCWNERSDPDLNDGVPEDDFTRRCYGCGKTLKSQRERIEHEMMHARPLPGGSSSYYARTMRKKYGIFWMFW